MNQLQNLPVEKLSLLLSVPFKEIMIKHSDYLKNDSIIKNKHKKFQFVFVDFYKKRIEIFGLDDKCDSYFIIINNASGIITGSFMGCNLDIKYKEILELQKLSAFL